MNQLNVSLQHSTVTPSAQGWSERKVASELGLNRETVGRYQRLAADATEPAISPTGSPDFQDSKPAILPIGSNSGRTSQCTHLHEVIQMGVSKPGFPPSVCIRTW